MMNKHLADWQKRAQKTVEERNKKPFRVHNRMEDLDG